MMFVASYARTMANARPVEPPKPRRERVIALARQWQRENASRREEEAAEAEWHLRRMKAIALHGPPAKKSAHDLVDYVAWWHGLTWSQLRSRENRKAWVEPRVDAIVAVKVAYPDWSLKQIGRAVNRDDSIVHRALKKRGLA